MFIFGIILPELEVGVDHPVGETFTANTDTFKYTVTGELMHYQMRINKTYEEKNTSGTSLGVKIGSALP